VKLGSTGELAHFDAADIGRLVRVRIEVPRWSFVKRKADGRVDLVSPLPCPYNYGSVIGSLAPDGDPLDALVLGPRLAFGVTVETRAWAVMGFLDDGVADPKLVCAAEPPTDAQRAGVERFFVAYAGFKRVVARLRGRGRADTRRLGWLEP
jgi:inorganic pyrophosphatase